MAEKEVKIKVTTEADVSQLEDLKSAIEEAKGLVEELGGAGSQNLSEVEDGAESAASSVDELGNNIDNINGESLNEAGSEADNLATSTDEASTSADNLNDSLGSVDGSGLSGASTEADGLSDSLSNAANNADEVNNSLSTIEGATLMGAASEINNYATGAENLAQEMNNASISVGQLATQTGIAEPQMVSLINNISNATFPNEEAMMYVKSLDQIGVASENLGKSATDLDKINDAFQLGATKVNSLGQELSVLGVDMNNVSSAFNALAYANANTVGGMDNYYNFLRKYDAQFKELGYDVDQASIIIAAATQKYGGGRAALSGLSDALKEADGDTRKLEEALGIQSGALDHASEVTGEYEGQLQNLANEEMEHKTWLDQLGAAWEDVSLSLSPVLSPLSSFIGLIGQIASFGMAVNGLWELSTKLRELSIVDSIKGKFSTFKQSLTNIASSARSAAASLASTLKNALTSVGNAAKTAAMSIGSTLKNALVGAANAAKEAVVWLARTSKELLISAGNALKSAAAWVYEKTVKVASTVATYAMAAAQELLNLVMSMNPILLVVTAIVALIAILWYLYNTCEPVRNAIDGIFAGIKGVIDQVIGWFDDLADTLNEFCKNPYEVTVKIIQEGADAGADIIGDTVGNLATNDASMGILKLLLPDDAVEEAKAETQSAIDEIVQGMFDFLSGNPDTVWNWLTDGFNSVMGSLQSSVGTSFGNVGAIIFTALTGITTNAGTQFEALRTIIWSKLTQIISNVTSFAGNFAGQLRSAATNAVSNFASGIGRLGQAFLDEINGIISDAQNFVGQIGQIMWNAAVNAWNNFLAGLDRHSPGIMMREFKAEMVGLVDTAKDTSEPLSESMKKLSTSAVKGWDNPDLKFNIDNPGNFSNSILTDLLNAITSLLNNSSTDEPTLIFNLYGDIDDEKRMEKFLNAVRKDLAWNNKTAGRTL